MQYRKFKRQVGRILQQIEDGKTLKQDETKGDNHVKVIMINLSLYLSFPLLSN